MRSILSKLLLLVIPLITVTFFLDVDYGNLKNIDNILLGAIAVSSSSLGFFIAGVSILQTSKISRFYKALTDLGTDRKIMSWLMTAISYMFVTSALSLISLFFSGSARSVKFLMDLWLSFLSASLLSTFFIILIFGIVFTRK